MTSEGRNRKRLVVGQGVSPRSLNILTASKFHNYFLLFNRGTDKYIKRGKVLITQQELKRLFIYEPETGILRSRRTGKALKADIIHNGYARKKIGRKNYLIHRLAWLYTYGKWPKDQLDHKNRNRLDNRIKNLREVTNRENAQNKERPVGCSFEKWSGRWKAQIEIDGRVRHIGRYDTQLGARRAYLKEVRKCN